MTENTTQNNALTTKYLKGSRYNITYINQPRTVNTIPLTVQQQRPQRTVQQTNDNIVSTKKTTSNTSLLPPGDNTEEQGHTSTRTQAIDHVNPYAMLPI